MRFVLLATLLSLAAAAAPSQTPVAGKVFGVPGAPMMIEVYSDFQCPMCKVLHEQVLPSLMKDYVAKGKVYLIHREFPLPIPAHIYSRQAASYASAAARIGKYTPVSDALFRMQASWSVDGKVDQTACSVLSPLEATKVRALVKDPSIAAEIQRDVQAGEKAAINQTPTMIVTFRTRQYPLSTTNYDLVRRFLDDLLAN
jgi:protein-disulfide isomerase